MKNSAAQFIIVFSLLFAMSCKKGPDGEVGPQGEKGKYESSKMWTYKEGYIRATAFGSRADGTQFSYDLNFQGNQSLASNSYRSNSGILITLSKEYAGDGDGLISGNFTLVFLVDNLNDLTLMGTPNMKMYFLKDIGNNSFHEFNRRSLGGSHSSGTVTDLNFDPVTSVLSGKFSMTVTGDDGTLNLSDGSFSTKISQLVFRKSAE